MPVRSKEKERIEKKSAWSHSPLVLSLFFLMRFLATAGYPPLEGGGGDVIDNIRDWRWACIFARALGGIRAFCAYLVPNIKAEAALRAREREEQGSSISRRSNGKLEQAAKILSSAGLFFSSCTCPLPRVPFSRKWKWKYKFDFMVPVRTYSPYIDHCITYCDCLPTK